MTSDEILDVIRRITQWNKPQDFEALEWEVRRYLIESGFAVKNPDRPMGNFDMIRFLFIQQYRQMIVIANQQAAIESLRAAQG